MPHGSSGLISPLYQLSALHSSSVNEERLKHLSTPPYVLPNHKKIEAPPMVYISGEEMTNYAMNLIVDQWIRPHLDIKHWVSSSLVHRLIYHNSYRNFMIYLVNRVI